MKLVSSVLICLLPFFTPADKSQLVVIVNSSNPTSILTKSEVKLIYLRTITKRWNTIKKNIVPVDRKDVPEIKKEFLSDILNMDPNDLDRYYTLREYQNAEIPPLQLSSDGEVIDYVEKNIGAIGYININSLNKEDLNKVKVIYP